MTTPERNVEEIVEEFNELVNLTEDLVTGGAIINSKEWKTSITEWLTQTLQAERQKREEMVGRAIDMSLGISGMPEHIATQMAEQMKTLFITQPNNPK